VVGAPGYFARHGRPGHPRDLRHHACLGYLYLATGETWRFTDANGTEETVTVKGPLSATNAEALSFALEAGCGVALQPDFIVWEAVRDGRLEIALDGWSSPSGAVHLITPAGGPRPTRVAVLLDFLAREDTGSSRTAAVRPRPAAHSRQAAGTP
jgi:DNA-binding transcriptional LysR family regulator